jgi:TM2 domain-containing membrane protein YozV
MKNSMKGALLSGLVLPGLGQMVQKRYGRGIILILVVTSSAVAILVKAFQQATAIMEQIDGDSVDMSTITDAVSRAMAASGSSTYRIAMVAIIVSWIVGIVDAYWTGRRMDLDPGSRSSASPPPARKNL